MTANIDVKIVVVVVNQQVAGGFPKNEIFPEIFKPRELFRALFFDTPATVICSSGFS